MALETSTNVTETNDRRHRRGTLRDAFCPVHILLTTHGREEVAHTLRLRDLGNSGFSVWTNVRFTVDRMHRFRFLADTSRPVDLTALTIHLQDGDSSSDARFIVGFAFVNLADPTIGAAVKLLVAHVLNGQAD